MADILFASLFDTSNLSPHGFCLLWQPGLIWLHVISDTLTALSYYSIPAALVWFVRKRRNLEFGWVFWLFAAFIVACGTTHLLSIWTLWNADYALQGMAKAFTAVVSVLTAIALWPLLPRVLAMPSQTELRELNDTLQREIEGHRLTLSRLHAAKERAEQANKAKSTFLANMSHELRTPLNAILGFSEALSKEFFGKLNEKQHEYATYIHRSGAHLLKIINDILDLSKVDAGRLELVREPVDVVELVIASVNLIRPKAEEHGVTVETELAPDLPMIEADDLRLRQIVLNLLSNAIKFTPPAGSIRVSTRALNDHQLEIVVSDTGIGMAPQDIPRALEMFTQVNNTLTRMHDGTGIGLPLSKALAELHGGRLEIDSEPGRGTTVTVQLPIVPAPVTA
ncbi:sensor histidine kinase [Azospirillum sp.]|uniref:sensor histidine kinase n=1 Tax=Azospirillum sp. TaxID=34012 RepID=UPI002D59CC53|nr:ATP-binding protein [Azospirillum sp.]HYD69233.1 ATP-binding protein [Azospirillum sp.]